MTTARCPACGASVAAGAQWCTLCFADLRSAREPADATLAPNAYLDAPLDQLATLLAPDQPVTRRADVRLAEPGWPCSGCGASVSIDLDACPECGTPFLGGRLDLPSLTLPGVGDLSRLDKAGKFVTIAVGSLLVTGVFVMAAEVLGHLL